MQKILVLLFLSTFFYHISYGRLPFSHIITFFIEEIPIDSKDAIKFTQTINTPGKIASKITQSYLQTDHPSIFATYGGYLTISDFNGQITFPRMQQKEELTLIITENIKPVFMIGNTIHHWELLPIPTQIYSVTRKQDPKTKLFYWDVEPEKSLPNNIIPLTSIVLFAKPKNIIVPIGITVTTDSPQLVLPPIYAKKNINILSPTLNILNIREFFGALPISIKKINNTYYSEQIGTQ